MGVCGELRLCVVMQFNPKILPRLLDLSIGNILWTVSLFWSRGGLRWISGFSTSLPFTAQSRWTWIRNIATNINLERERETDRQTDRQRERQRDRETEREDREMAALRECLHSPKLWNYEFGSILRECLKWVPNFWNDNSEVKVEPKLLGWTQIF